MNGAESLVRTMVKGGVDVCFSNPGTSEMHFVAALDRVPGMRCVLGLFEGVVTGAADGYFRMKGTPASTLLHLGPGLANGLANLHNAKKANSGIVNIVGQHAVYHIAYNAPLTSDIEGLARPMSSWVRTSPNSKSVAADGAAAIAAARSAPPQIATLILPADTAWNEAEGIAEVPAEQQRASYSPQAVEQAAKILHGDGEGTLLLMTGSALSEQGLALAERIAAKTGCTVMGPTFRPRMARGRGRFSIDRIHYVIDNALQMLAKFRHIVLVESDDPVAFFAYPNKPSILKPEGCDVHRMTSWGENSVAALEALAGAVKASAKDVKPQAAQELLKPTGALTHASIAQSIAYAIPENAILIDESLTTRPRLLPADGGRRSARLAPEHGRLDRFLDAALDWCRDRLPGSQGDLHGRRRQRDVHDPVAVDAGPRESQHRHHRVRQSHLPDPARRVRQCRRRRARPARQRHAPPRPADAGFRGAGQGHGRPRPRRHQRGRVQQGAGRSRRRARTAADRSPDVGSGRSRREFRPHPEEPALRGRLEGW
ncbi:hypothetical protein ACVWWP_001903 [Bradyrhizobium sp. LM3.6]